MENALAAARRLASLPPFAFAQTKKQMRQPVVERLERTGAANDKIAIEIWAAAETLDHVRNYVARTLKKA
jgi:enoyl-CoA hydratase